MSADRFRYDGYELDPDAQRIVCQYSLGAHRFAEDVSFDVGGDRDAVSAAWASDAAEAAARILFLLAGVSYYKTAAPRVVDLGSTETTAAERAFLRTFYVEGLAELALRNHLDLSGIEITGPDRDSRSPARAARVRGGPLVPFGAGIDSIVTAEHVARRHPGTSLFVVSRAGDRFEAIEGAAKVTGLPIVRADRRIDPSVLRSAESGFVNGHVPVTGILSAIAVMAAVLGGHDAVVMANERSASVPTIWDGAHAVNHQWSKSIEFERGFRELLSGALGSRPDYFSFLRARSELWVAAQFAVLDRYHGVFRSCNRAFSIDPARRLDRWCGECDKCCFIDLVLAPFVPAVELSAIFDGHEPLSDDALAHRFRALVGTGTAPKPFECVGDEEECRVATVAAASRPDRAHAGLLHRLAAEVRDAAPWLRPGGDAALAQLLERGGPDFVPLGFADDSPGRDDVRAAGGGPAPDVAPAPGGRRAAGPPPPG